MKEHRKFIKWVKTHKKALAIAGISVVGLIAIIVGIRNKEVLKAFWCSLRKSIEQPTKAVVKVPVAHTPKPQVIHPVVEAVKPVAQAIEPAIEETVTITRRASLISFEVDPHIRDLHPGWHASPEKIATAAAHGFDLKDGQTWVEAYIKGGAVA